MDKTSELKPCPFCGADNNINPNEMSSIRLVGTLGDIWVMCSNCDDLLVGSFEKPEEATQAWNRRQS